MLQQVFNAVITYSGTDTARDRHGEGTKGTYSIADLAIIGQNDLSFGNAVSSWRVGFHG